MPEIFVSVYQSSVFLTISATFCREINAVPSIFETYSIPPGRNKLLRLAMTQRNDNKRKPPERAALICRVSGQGPIFLRLAMIFSRTFQNEEASSGEMPENTIFSYSALILSASSSTGRAFSVTDA